MSLVTRIFGKQLFFVASSVGYQAQTGQTCPSIHQGSRFLPVKLRLLSVLGLHVFEVVGPPVVDPDECRVVHVQTRPRRGHGFQRLCVLDERGPQLETLPRLRQVVLQDKVL